MAVGRGAARGGVGARAVKSSRRPWIDAVHWVLLTWANLRISFMQAIKFVHWEDAGKWIGYFQDYPDYWTQGDSLDDLKAHLRDLYGDLTSGQIPSVRKVDELSVS
jgi:hypothetical protein